MTRRYPAVLLVTLLAGSILLVTACGQPESVFTSTTAVPIEDQGEATTTTLPPSENPIKIVFNGEISGPLVYDAALVKKGIRTALSMLGDRIADWSVEYTEIDNRSDPLLAVDQVRSLVEMYVTDAGGKKIKVRDPVDYICGPLSSSAAAAVSYFLSQRGDKRERVPQCSVTAQPRENITTSGGVGFIPNGIYSSHGYYLGKFASETLHFQTANCIHYTDRIAEEIQSGFERGFTAGGGSISSLTYVPSNTVDFSQYFAAMPAADCTMFWVRGTGAVPFIRQYVNSGLRGQLLVPQSSNYSESELEYLEALGIGPNMIACDVYTPLIDNEKNDEFIAAYRSLYPGEYPTPEVFGGWQAIMLYARAVEILAQQRDEGIKNSAGETLDPRNPLHVIEMMASLDLDTPAGLITMGKYGKTYVATRDFYILRSRDVGGGRIAWAPVYTYSQVRMGQ